MLRELLARAVYWCKGLRSSVRHERLTADALCGQHRPDLSAKEKAHVDETVALMRAWKTGEFATVTPAFDHPEPIGPREPVPTFYADLLAESSTWMSPDTLARLEGPTGCWRAGDFSEVSR